MQSTEGSSTNGFRCASCPKEFTTKYRLDTHVNRFHTAEDEQKRHPCPLCPYWTTFVSDLTRHLKGKHGVGASSSEQGGR
ncbi:hypothetical protein HYPSUDRAFT_46740 [Hypholoma sublateritium FD-334 SS-4]|uniref:C2H2-type domain-containing protein n=1 Tax=Hypholoma sublateritium (strain FD-334 SS-4) TaxID=945553 RepID=A0A0D2NKK9_HYPSF|nr:hypothetical protein HYPSUDRAFT_46740 [Hypholoma sublateritium FD-334 SS-4]